MMGAVFEDRPSVGDPIGCRIDRPLALTKLNDDVSLKPEALLNCSTAEVLAGFVNDIAEPAALEQFGEALQSLRHNSAYVCRARSGSSKLSEHAFGNAIDIADFTLKSGRVIDVRIYDGEPESKAAVFQDRLHKAACGPFKTVLGPASDDDHANHFHFDLAPRRNGSTYCR